MDGWTSVNWLWPNVADAQVARWAAREGALAALVAATLCLLDAREEILFLAPAALFLVLAVAIWQFSLLAASAGFLLCGANLLLGLVLSLQMSSADYQGFSKVLWIVTGALALAFLNSIRGIRAVRKALNPP